jgi:hypothetical protein
VQKPTRNPSLWLALERFAHSVVVCRPPEEPWTFALIVDTDKKIVTVQDYEPVPIGGDASKNTIVFVASPATNIYGVSSGTLNRLTGAASIHIIRSRQQ